ncbi:MAG TPA: shewanella-like protein phosphatase [Labilithrix sp.]|nr:shewanella-like protein phosphatase [Labilithrix sp.]
MRLFSATVALVLLASACDKPKEPDPSPTPERATAPLGSTRPAGSLAVSKPAPERVVAIGDLHGDFDATRRALRLAGAIDAQDAWVGGKLVVVQTGDLIDRGDDDRKILDLVERLKDEAPKSGGELIALVGNHEIMNDQLDFRYVTPGAFAAFSNVTPKDESVAHAAATVDSPQRGRAAAFLPRGPYAQILAKRPVVARVGDSIFVHGGVIPRYVKNDGGLDAINAGARAWLLGEKDSPPKALVAEDGPLWTRMYSAAPSREDCAVLHETLGLLKAKRMVMGHTVQKPDISPACDEKAWRIDVGMSKFYGGPIEVLELRGDDVKVLKEGPR